MRILMWFTLGAAAACAGCVWLLNKSWIIPAVAVCLIFLAVTFFLRKKKQGKIIFLILLGIVSGLLYKTGFDAGKLRGLENLDGSTVPLSITAQDYSYDARYGSACDGRTNLNGKEYRIRFYLNTHTELKPGDQVSGKFRIRLMSRDPAATAHCGKEIFLLAYPKGEEKMISAPEPSLRYAPQILKHRLENIIDEVFPSDTGPFARSLFLGESWELDYATDTALKVSGIRHIIAVSGLHISVLCGMLSMLAGKHKIVTPVICIPVLCIFASAVGFTPSVLRAGIMFSLMLLAVLLNREYDGLTALSFAALCLLLENPYVITSASFQLSFGCVAGILQFAKPIANWLKAENRLGPCQGKSLKARFGRGLTASVSVSLSAMSLTTPLAAVHFGTVSLIGPLTNLLVLWAVPIVFCGIAGACALGAIWLPAGKIIAWLVSWFIRYILLISGLLAKIPVASVYTVSKWIVLWLVLCYGLFILAAALKKWNIKVLLGVSTLSLCAALLLSYLLPMHYGISATVLDVGQGQSVLLQSEGKSYLVDCGGTSGENAADQAAEMLLSQGITHLDGIVVSHYDEDHTGGIEPLLSRIPADTVYLPEQGDSPLKNRDNICFVRDNMLLSAGNMKLTMFPGISDGCDNDSSISVLFQNGNCDILVIGDREIRGEADLLRQMNFPPVEVLVVGHHGSKTSTCKSLLQELQPQWAVISAGKDNPFGHPAQSVLDRLEAYGCRIWRTDQQGTFIYQR